MSEIVERIKSRINISSLIARRVQLKRKSNGEYLGCCPFHNEKTPSFYVSDKRGKYHCFGCGADGDIFNFLMNLEGLSFIDTLKQLAQESGVELPKEREERFDKNESIYQIYEATASYYTNMLHSKVGEKAMYYLKKRGLRDEIIRRNRLGYAPENHHDLLNFLKEKGFSYEDIIIAKIIRQSEREDYSHFRNRVMFPIIDRKERVVAFGGRILENIKAPKYINSPETLIFDKSFHLYGIQIAFKPSVKTKRLIIVEGYLDVLALQNSGIDYAVAPLGTSVGIHHLELMWGMVGIPTVCMDSDAAGKKANERIIDIAIPNITSEKTLRFASYIGAKDPDEFISKFGPKSFEQVIENATPLADYIFELEVEQGDLQSPEGRTKLKRKLDEIASKILDKEVSRAYLYHLRGRFFNDVIRKKTNIPVKRYQDKIIIQDKNEEMLLRSIFEQIIINDILIKDEEVLNIISLFEIENTSLNEMRIALIDFIHDPSDMLLRDKLKSLVSNNDLLYTTISEVKESLIRIFKLHQLGIIEKKISKICSQLIDNPDINTYEKLREMKLQEESLKRELNLFN